MSLPSQPINMLASASTSGSQSPALVVQAESSSRSSFPAPGPGLAFFAPSSSSSSSRTHSSSESTGYREVIGSSMSSSMSSMRPGSSYDDQTLMGGRSVPPRKGSSNKSGSGEDEPAEELTSKGKKRKRLAKACSESPSSSSELSLSVLSRRRFPPWSLRAGPCADSRVSSLSLFRFAFESAATAACHKNKRRCTGELPCSNCEFSGRECVYLSSKGEPVAAPRASRPRSNSIISTASSSGRSPTTDSLLASFGATSLRGSISGKDSPTSPSSGPSLLAVPMRQQTAFSMGQSSLGEGFYGGAARKSGQTMTMMMGIAEAVEGATASGGMQPVSSMSLSSGWQPLSMQERYPMAPFSPSPNFPPTPSTHSFSPSSITRPVLARDPLASDPLLKRSLISLFFSTFSDPLTSIFHRPTFDASVYEQRTSPLLLNAIYAWSARISNHASFEGAGERWTRGEPFAEEVRRVVESAGWREGCLEGAEAEGEWEEIEKAQVLVLMVVYESLLRRGERTTIYLDILISFITRLTRPDNPPPPTSPTSPPPSLSSITARETRSRIFWLTYVVSTFLDAQSPGASSSAARFSAQDCRLALPVEDGRFEMGACGEGLRGDTLTHHGHAEKEVVSELGHLARVARVFRDVLSSTSSSSSNQEASLKSWATSLPAHLQFNESNLSGACSSISSSASSHPSSSPPGGERGHGFSTIHTTAEVCMFFHLSSLPRSDFTETRQGQAIANLEFVLDAIGEKGRRNPFVVFPLHVISQWRQANPSPATSSRLQGWWTEVGALYGGGTTTTLSPMRSPTLVGDLPPSPASNSASAPISRTNSTSRLSLPSISTLTGPGSAPISSSSRGRSSSNASISSNGGGGGREVVVYPVPARPGRSDSFGGGGAGAGTVLPVPVVSGSPGWLFGTGPGNGAGTPAAGAGGGGGGGGGGSGYF